MDVVSPSCKVVDRLVHVGACTFDDEDTVPTEDVVKLCKADIVVRFSKNYRIMGLRHKRAVGEEMEEMERNVWECK